ncbi:MAG: monovalent cation/H+ antiporter complex subunit F [Pseudoclavibacter sp.]
MTALDIVLTVLWGIIGVAFAVGGVLSLWRMVIGPTIIDRMVASDTILTIIICLLGADMVMRGHTESLPLMLVLGMTAFIASVAVARYVSRQDKSHDGVDSDGLGGGSHFDGAGVADGSGDDGSVPGYDHDAARNAADTGIIESTTIEREGLR